MSLEDDKIATGQIQSFYQAVAPAVLSSDSLLMLFKKAELDATMSAASNGSYYSYWTIDKITDLNNLVDKTPSCPSKLKDVFAPGHSRNPRIRGNRIGAVIFDHVKELMANGGGGLTTSTAAPAAPPTSAPAPIAVAAAPAAAPAQKLLTGRALKKFIFSPDLPGDCQLRVRATPSMDGAPVGTVTAKDTIMATLDLLQGDWLRVQIGGWADEAWMLTAMGGQQLLVLDVPAAAPAPAVPEPARPPAPAAPDPVPPPPQQQPQLGGVSPHLSRSAIASPSRPVTAPTNTSFYGMHQMQQQQPNVALSYGGIDPMSMTQMNMNMSMMGGMGAGGGGVDASMAAGGQQFVPYEMYRRLEIRVNKLDVELNALKMALRSI